ncbi:non-hydrolyzing UDP-N-acetylglucosamine 2-epimerase [Pseudorhodoplanes sinuspersici]|uniref:UDP-N-acetylglucosamine 2-epimerase (non-hydrolyzing) n=1 Tax=Pseudorhodoplanes sinuspersici TaxID=1235591 RepID=A0A1W7A068_9HYPH|nr:UDP-N-acetylglucosamine 2-epimerase (non-hydrolyzing) [Pseudorhodoplanes sinuspersici]ARQ02425.1 UDP-N-acetylglucosamine 2-epimerase (non-hydrolyzing) [Pseudorhodoplanes sinuspersici]RKE74261.1 UDP-N-acetylglucosamine 2-epimerase [Pseudorhodoplanes sinuspersici]
MNILVTFGTRPEAIKLFPVIHALKRERDFNVTVCVTAQHREMLDQVLDIADIEPDLDLDIMRPNQSLPEMTSRIIRGFDEVLSDVAPDRVMVQGDTTTAMAAALSAFYRKIPVDHVEAGLRSGDIYSPWPEEVNRKVVGSIASLHFAPTERAAESLIRENVPRDRIFVTGNTVIDALLQTKQRIEEQPALPSYVDDQLPDEDDKRHLILVTAHRRENFDGGMERIAAALLKIVEREDVVAVFPVHPNPNVMGPMRAMLGNHPRIRLLPPQDYVPFVRLLSRCHLVLTDSGGVQEEAPALGKPVLVMRDTTERPEGVEAGTALLVGTDPSLIAGEALRLLQDRQHYLRMSRAHNPFGDGRASERIIDVLSNEVLPANRKELKYAV